MGIKIHSELEIFPEWIQKVKLGPHQGKFPGGGVSLKGEGVAAQTLARDLVVDLVVMGGYGRKGRGKIEEVFFGSTAEKVVRLLPCPVLCIPK